MFRLLLPLGAAAVLAFGGAAAASTGGVRYGRPIEGTGSTSTTVSSGPALVVSAARPLVVRGSRFVRDEHVRVSFRAGTLSVARTVRTTPAGTFSLTAPQSLVYDPCSTTLVIAARGATGDLVTLERPPRGCAPG
jgi:hypothetical protein